MGEVAAAARFAGVRALDLGPSDGFFSMKMAQSGADVTAIDNRAKDAHGFAVMERLSGLSFDYRRMNLYDIEPSEFEPFDIVLFLGVLYHLPDMLRALDIAARLCRGRLLVETQYEADLMPGVAVARYCEASTFAGDITNFWVPNRECLYAMLRDVGLQVDREDSWGDRLLVETSRTTATRVQKLDSAYGLFSLTG
ncbi:MAG: methyltransferase domain-containing protein [Hyphomicrobiales bacterium]